MKEWWVGYYKYDYGVLLRVTRVVLYFYINIISETLIHSIVLRVNTYQVNEYVMNRYYIYYVCMSELIYDNKNQEKKEIVIK